MCISLFFTVVSVSVRAITDLPVDNKKYDF
jgi:hypothetical protein